MTRKLLLGVLAGVLLAGAVVAGIAVAGKDKGNDKNFEYAVGLWGDLPYSTQQEALIPGLIQDMNNADLAFTIDDGDLKQGSNSPCDDALYQRALGWFDSLEKPAIFTPGDNDWTDCDRASNGGFDSRERLDHERQLFFSTDRSLGRHTLKQDVQTAKECLNAGDQLVACSENRRWLYHDVMYATFNVQGSCNNLCDTNRQHTGDNGDPAEYAARNQANLEWLQQTFAAAEDKKASAIMLVSQADPGWDLSDSTRAPLRSPTTLHETDAHAAQDGYYDWLTALRRLVIQFAQPVAYVNGDSHYVRIDKPLLDVNGKRIDNFTRVETFGDNQTTMQSPPQPNTNDVQWLKVLVDPKSRDVFAFQPQIIPENWSVTTG
jgi:hypothetical protein